MLNSLLGRPLLISHGMSNAITLRQTGSRWRFSDIDPVIIVVTALFLIALPTLFSFAGLGGDSTAYLDAARCWVANGFCVPETHWAARLPLVAPLALTLSIFGDGGIATLMPAFLYSLGAVALFTSIVAKLFGRVEAILAGLILGVTPIFLASASSIGVDMTELFWMMAGLRLLLSGSPPHAPPRLAPLLLAGLCFAVMIESRMTSLAALPIIGAPLLWASRSIRPVIYVAVGFAVGIGAEILFYSALGQPPLLPWTLSLSHSHIPTSALPPGVDVSGSPLFNLALIRNWETASGIHVHWTVDALLNLLASPVIGMTLLAAPVLVLLNRNRSAVSDESWPWIGFAAAAALFYFVTLVFVFAIHPTPRMFCPLVALASMTAGVLAVRGNKSGFFLVLGLLIIGLFKAIFSPSFVMDARPIERQAERWIAAAGTTPVAIDLTTRKYLDRSVIVHAKPATERAGPGFTIAGGTLGCAKLADELGQPTLVSHWAYRQPPPKWAGRVLKGPDETFHLCLFKV